MARVLQVITDTNRRGAQLFAVDLERGLRARGHVVATVALSHGTHPQLDVPILGLTPLGIRTLRRLRRMAESFDLVVAHGSKTLAASALALQRTSVPFIYRSIGEPSYWANTAFRRLRMRLLLRSPSAIVALWSGAADELVRLFGVRPERVRVIPQGADSIRFAPADPSRRLEARQRLGVPIRHAVVAYLGSLTPEKNVDAAIHAVCRLPSTCLVVAGDGPERDRLHSFAERLGPGRVIFVGSTHEPEQVLAAADIVVLPSRTEGMPGVLIEAGMMNIPVVATSVGGIPEIIANGSRGRLVAVRDDEALVPALREMLQAPLRGGDSSRAHSRGKFDLDVVVTAWERVLQGVADGEHARTATAGSDEHPRGRHGL